MESKHLHDNEIVQLYFERNETAISETASKYGRYLEQIAFNILSDRQDAEECVNDTYNKAWNAMPPHIPASLKAFLGRIIRNAAISRYRMEHAARRYSGMEVLLSELEECIPGTDDVESRMEAKELANHISKWLYTISEKERIQFVRRYWYAQTSDMIAAQWGEPVNRINVRLCRLRKELKKYLEQEEMIHGA